MICPVYNVAPFFDDKFIVVRNDNGRVGPNPLAWKGVLGRHDISNDIECLLIDFCGEHQLILPNTIFLLKNSSKITWMYLWCKNCSLIMFYCILKPLLLFCEQYWTSPGGNTSQGTNYTATCLRSRKLSKLDEPAILPAILLGGQFRHWITREGWYAIKQQNTQTNQYILYKSYFSQSIHMCVCFICISV